MATVSDSYLLAPSPFFYKLPIWELGGFRSLKEVRSGDKITEKRPESLRGQLAKAYKASSNLPLYKDNL